MAHTFSNLVYHLVWSTKNRERLIPPDIEKRLYEYLGGAIRAEGGTCICIGGTADHIHILVKLKPAMDPATLVGRIKSNSSGWVRREFKHHKFGWQAGYGVFTVSASHVDRLRRYIANQKRHHGQASFGDELLRLSDGGGLDGDSRFLSA